jgi:hypothetical protein
MKRGYGRLRTEFDIDHDPVTIIREIAVYVQRPLIRIQTADVLPVRMKYLPR